MLTDTVHPTPPLNRHPHPPVHTATLPAAVPIVSLNQQPLYAALVQFPVVCFAGALVADLAYWRTALFTWETFSVWLLAAGCVMAGVAGIVGLVVFLRDPRVRQWQWAWPHALTSLAAALLSVVNAFVHSRDGYTAVVPDGLALSAAVVVLMVAATVLGWPALHKVPRHQGAAA